MDFYQFYNENDHLDNAPLIAASRLIELGFKVLPCNGKEPTDKVKSVTKIRLKPIHENNVDFFFTGSENIAILTGDNLEVIDLDCKYDLTGNLYRYVANAIRYTMPDVWDKLVIQRTATRGYHLFYKCSVIGGNQKLARRYTIGAEKELGERIKVLIETRGEGGYIMVCPTPGYLFIKGSPTDITEITPEERAELMAICRSFDKTYSLDLPGISKSKQLEDTAPWNAFNAKHGWEFIRDELLKAGWETLREDDERLFVLRPGAKSKSSGAIWKETNILFLFSTSTEFPDQRPISAFDIVRYLKYDGDVVKAAKDLAEQGYGQFLKDEGEFYTKTDTGAIKHSLRAIVNWMHDIGIRRYFVTSKEYEVVQVIDNKVRIIDHNYLKKLFTDYVCKTCPVEIDEYFLSKITTIFSKESIVNLLEKLEDNFLQSTQDTAWLFYENSAIQITSTKVILHEYNSLHGYVWESSIIKRKIYFGETDCHARKFIENIGKDNRDAFESAIGFLLHSYKDPANPKCVILYDEYFDRTKEEREPEGGTGKGIFIKILAKFRNTVIIDGKKWNNTSQFAYQQLNPDTEIVAFEDVRYNFDFEQLFSVVTDDWTIEKKNMGAFSIPFERSPKIVITSNYPLKGVSKSHMRRRYELEVSSYYNSDNTVVKEFGHRFFTDWNEKEWNKFDNYIIECIQGYLRDNLKEVKSVELQISRLISETNIDFVRWMDLQVQAGLPAVVSKDDFLLKFTDKFPDYRQGRNQLTQKLFSKWIRRYCDTHCIRYDGSNNFNGKMCYRFGESQQGKQLNLNDETPF